MLIGSSAFCETADSMVYLQVILYIGNVAALAAEATRRQRERRVARWIVAGSLVAAMAMMGLAGTAF